MLQRRLVYLAAAAIVIVLGLASRWYRANLPSVVGMYAGDTLWALMVFLGWSALRPVDAWHHRAVVALGFAFCIELSQLYHAAWIDTLRHTSLGHLVLGAGFVGTDFACYAFGVAIGVGLEWGVFRLGNLKPKL